MFVLQIILLIPNRMQVVTFLLLLVGCTLAVVVSIKEIIKGTSIRVIIKIEIRSGPSHQSISMD